MRLQSLFVYLLFIASFTSTALAQQMDPPIWAYDPGPNQYTEMGSELIELNAKIPYFPGISSEVMHTQKFRPAFGPIAWRMLQEPNSVKILFIGQDGTHIAEAAGRPATAGFGGRAHDLANHFGVDYSAAFINTYAFTIRGQYGDRGVPYFQQGQIKFTSQFLDNELWLMSQGQDSPITQWRNGLIDWIIRNNRDSLKMIVTFGGSARDSIASYIESKPNGKVGTRLNPAYLQDIEIPEYRIQYAGGNNTFPTPIDREGNDIYEILLGYEPNYVPPFQGFGAPDDQKKAKDALLENLQTAKNLMVFARGGRDQSGILHPAQLGGYDISKIEVDGRKTISLKGLKLNDNSEITNDVLVVDLPHPTYLSNVQREPGGHQRVSELVSRKTYSLEYWRDQRGWRIAPDVGVDGDGNILENAFDQGLSYSYGRGEIGQEYYDFGTPGNRMVSKSDAKRLNTSAILLGVREDNYFYKSNQAANYRMQQMMEVKAAEPIDSTEMFISISRTELERNDFDPGPGEEFARIMKTSLYGEKQENLNQIFRERSVQNGKKVADFGHYRGTFVRPKAVILADPQGWDDIITARALTGRRGQYLQGLMKAVSDDMARNHLVLKTVPFGMQGATQDQWNTVLGLTDKYRNDVLTAVLDQGLTDVLITDGEYAKKALEKFLQDNNYEIPVVNIQRVEGESYSSEMVDGANQLRALGFPVSSDYQARRANIPSSHLSYYARVWEGTSGDRVITTPLGYENFGVAFAEVVPNWVTDQVENRSVVLMLDTERGIDKMISTLCESMLPLPGERPYRYLDRVADGDPNCD